MLRLLLHPHNLPGIRKIRTSYTITMYKIDSFQNKTYQLIFLLPVLGMIFLSACQKPSITFGNSFIANNNTSVVVTDTPLVRLSTLLLDSFPTAGSGAMLLGRYNDPQFGTITTKTFLQLGIPTSRKVSQYAGFDSIAIIMHINKTFYADTTVTQRYYVSQLKSVIQLPTPQQTTFYSNSSIPYNPDPLGFTDVRIDPERALTTQNALDTVKIRIADSLGQRLLVMLKNNSDTISNLNTFLGYFKGLVLYSDTSSPHVGTLYGFKDSVYMRLYFHEPGPVTTYKFIDFPFNNNQHQFNQITVDRTGTPLEILSSLQSKRPNPLIPTEASSALTGNTVFVQGISGIQTKITFPNIANLLNLPDYIGIMKAQLILKPINGSFNPTLPLPSQLILSVTDENNIAGSPLIFNGGIQYGNLNVDYVYGQNTTYSYDVTNYIKQQLTIGGINNNGLILNVPSPASRTTFNRAVFGDNTNQYFTIKLKIYYISLVH